MQEDTAALNDRWAALLIDLLVQQNVTYFCLSPGSRCTPLALAIANHPKAKTFVHFDERGAAFHALGYAKATGKPAAVISTSGTAVGNLFPAVMEAALGHTPLIVITADRPPELRDVSANQTLDQVKIFGTYLRFFMDLPPPNAALPEQFLATTVAQAVFSSLQPPYGPVHLNCMYREPLFSMQPPSLPTTTPLNYESCTLYPSEEQFERWADRLSEYEKGIILAGSLPRQMEKKSILALSKKLGWPILPDIFSGLRTDPEAIGNHDLILKSIPEMPLDALLHLGDRVVSKTVSEWIQKAAPKRYFQVIGHPLRSDPAHQVTDRLFCAPDVFCDGILPRLPEKISSWAGEWRQYNQKIKESLKDCFNPEASISEPSLFYFLQSKLPLFLANSMPVRDAHFFLTDQELGPIFGNRGVSGIDGNIATAVGLAQGLKTPLIAIIGDQTALHDLNSLAQMKQAKYPVILIVINNKGGGIFSFLPVSKKETALVDKFFAASHRFSFEPAAALFGLDYYRFKTMDAFFLPSSACLIEIETERQENVQLHQQIYQKCLHSVSCMVS